MRTILIVGAGGFGLAVAGVALALARWDFTMEGGGNENIIDYLPIPMVLLGAPVSVGAVIWGMALLVIRMLKGDPPDRLIGPIATPDSQSPRSGGPPA